LYTKYFDQVDAARALVLYLRISSRLFFSYFVQYWYNIISIQYNI